MCLCVPRSTTLIPTDQCVKGGTRGRAKREKESEERARERRDTEESEERAREKRERDGREEEKRGNTHTAFTDLMPYACM